MSQVFLVTHRYSNGYEFQNCIGESNPQLMSRKLSAFKYVTYFLYIVHELLTNYISSKVHLPITAIGMST